jgi:hypothetical protein
MITDALGVYDGNNKDYEGGTIMQVWNESAEILMFPY